VFPAWLQKRLNVKKNPMISVLINAATKGQTIEHPLTLNTFVTKQLCEACNCGWMANLEGQVQNLLEPIFSGKTAVADLKRTEHDVLLRWAMKTALTTLAAKEFRFYRPPQEHYSLLAEGRNLPDGLHCVTATIGTEGYNRCGAYICGGPLLLEEDGEHRFSSGDFEGGYAVILQVGPIAFMVIYLPSPDIILLLNREKLFPIGRAIGEYGWFSCGAAAITQFDLDQQSWAYMESLVWFAKSLPNRGERLAWSDQLVEVVGPPYGFHSPAPQRIKAAL
jgi:hypothetical protein